MRPRETSLPKACLCPHCGASLDASTNIDYEDGPPEVGDYSMCLHCGVILIYQPDMTVRRAELDDLAKLPRETLLLLMKAQAAQHWAKSRVPHQKPGSKH